ncbi:MAG: hypothetical protein JSV91_12940 [Phycisphaerales bacterium]|nr:MAG: hypothetical protein JSV91_12940 [Phycisphaerales bacterium]
MMYFATLLATTPVTSDASDSTPLGALIVGFLFPLGLVLLLLIILWYALRIQIKSVKKQETALTSVDESLSLQKEALELSMKNSQLVEESLALSRQGLEGQAETNSLLRELINLQSR